MMTLRSTFSSEGTKDLAYYICRSAWTEGLSRPTTLILMDIEAHFDYNIQWVEEPLYSSRHFAYARHDANVRSCPICTLIRL
jgi:hypothetical protein